MSAFFLPEPPPQAPRTGVLLLNLGTPAAPTAAAVRPFLREFLSDTRVIELPRALWQLILRGIILPFRSSKSAHAYAQIWQENGSPLMVDTRRQTEAAARLLADAGQTPLIAFAMTYGEPSVAGALADMKTQGVERLLVIPLYPQYAASSTGAALDKVWRVLLKQRKPFAVRSVRSFYGDSGYIAALADSIRRYRAEHGSGKLLLMSFHGIPKKHHDLGDPYPDECRATAALLAEALNLKESEYRVAFQSRFGKAEWIGPSTQDLLTALPGEGITDLDVVCPGFTADCLETLEEIALRGRDDFLAAGGKTFRYIPCLNDSQPWAEALAAIISRHTNGWHDI